MSRFLIWGGGGHGKVVADVVRAAGHTVAGYVDADPAKLGQVVEPGGARVVLLEEDFLAALQMDGRLPPDGDAVALALGDNATRLSALKKLSGIDAPPLVHPTAVVSASVRLGPATVVFAGAVVNAAARIGSAVIVNSAAVVEHDCDIADGVHLSPGSTLGGGVRVGRGSWVGIGSTVIQNVTLGADTLVGAGAVVIRDVLDGTRVVGVPARPMNLEENR